MPKNDRFKHYTVTYTMDNHYGFLSRMSGSQSTDWWLYFSGYLAHIDRTDGSMWGGISS